MKNSAIDVYKKIPIYRDVTSDDIYIYTRKHGAGRINFSTLKECREYIDDNLEDINCAKNVIVSGCGSKKRRVTSAEEITESKEFKFRTPAQMKAAAEKLIDLVGPDFKLGLGGGVTVYPDSRGKLQGNVFSGGHYPD